MASVAVAALLIVLVRAELPIEFAIASIFVGTMLGVRRSGKSRKLWQAAWAGSLGGALGGWFGGLVYGIKEHWGEFVGLAAGHVLARGVGVMAMGWAVGGLLGILLGMIMRETRGHD